MVADIKTDTSDVDGYARAMKAAPITFKREVISGINRVTTEGEARAKRYVGTDTHDLQRSISMAPAREIGGGFQGVWGTNRPHARPHEEGRRAGAPMPPEGALLGWMRRHGIPEDQEFVVRRGIGRKGIPAKRFMARSRSEIKPLVRREIQAAVRRTLAQIRSRR
jgi:hypothetical protein